MSRSHHDGHPPAPSPSSLAYLDSLVVGYENVIRQEARRQPGSPSPGPIYYYPELPATSETRRPVTGVEDALDRLFGVLDEEAGEEHRDWSRDGDEEKGKGLDKGVGFGHPRARPPGSEPWSSHGQGQNPAWQQPHSHSQPQERSRRGQSGFQSPPPLPTRPSPTVSSRHQIQPRQQQQQQQDHNQRTYLGRPVSGLPAPLSLQAQSPNTVNHHHHQPPQQQQGHNQRMYLGRPVSALPAPLALSLNVDRPRPPQPRQHRYDQ